MIKHITFLTLAAAAAFSLPLVAGCTKQEPATTAPPDEDHEVHGDDEDAAANHHEGESGGEHGHGGTALTEEDVKTPESFADGVARIKELHEQINHLIEHNELAKVHRTAEEMAIVARKMKPLAARDIAEDQRTEAGRLCNEIAAYFGPIDEVADAGKKDETIAIHKQMAETIAKLETLTMK
jgi:hypothetical protein